jgi:glycosyltransferase involved in cell wall biosynthesis
MRILRIADVDNNRTGGMSRTMYCTGDELIGAGHQVDYLFRPDLVARKGPRRFTVPLLLPSLVRSIQRKGRQYDVVEIHEPLGAAYCWQRQHKKDLPPVVLFSYGLEERGRLAELAYRQQKGLPISLKKRWSPLTVIRQAAYAVRHADHVICSNSIDVAYLERAGVPRRRLTQHHSGADPVFLAAGATRDPERADILFIGSWLQRKGILDIVPAVSRVLEENPCLKFTIAGCGGAAATVMDQFPAEIRPRIQVIPFIGNNEMLIDVYRRHAIFLLPSFFEGQPLVMMEAAALGLAMVTTNIGGITDFVEDGANGFIVEVGDVEALTTRLRTLVQHPDMAARLGENARSKVQRYTWAAAAEKIAAAYENARDAGGRAQQ